MERQKVLLEQKVDLDVLGFAKEGGVICLCLVFVRNGMVVGEKPFFFEEAEPEEAFEALVREFYMEDREKVPILSAAPVPLLLKQTLEFIEPDANYKNVLVFAQIKAREHLTEYLEGRRSRRRLLEEARVLLGLRRLPFRIEGYDISNIQGEEAVGSMVVFEDGEPAKSEYRRFRIKCVEGPNDYAMHQEVIRRRIAHSEWRRPDLILIDGGVGQLNSVLEVIREARWDVDVLAISKGEDRDYIWGPSGALDVPKGHPVYHLLQRVRDESHRFAVSYHRRLRAKASFEGIEAIKGIGPKRRERILKFLAEHPDVEDPEELAKGCGIPVRLASEVLRILREEKACR